MNWAEVLVYILAAFLVVFLLLAIILVVLLIRITKQIKRVTTSAERTVAGMERAAVSLGSLSSPLAVAKLVATQLKKVKGKKR